MKQLLALITVFTLVFTVSAFAQNDKSQRPSPPASSAFKVGTANIKISYSAPSVKGREIWGKLVPYGEVWRTGANEATVFETDQDIKVEGKELPKGKYALFTIPGKDEWIIIFSKNANQWGTFKYNQAEDALRVTVRPGFSGAFNEQLKIEGKVDGSVSIMWEKLEIIFTVTQ